MVNLLNYNLKQQHNINKSMSTENKKYNTRSSKKEIIKNKKINPPNDEDNSSDEEINDLEYKKFLGKLFPSKYMKDKVKEEELKKEDSIIKSKKKNIKEDNTDMKNFNIIFTIQDKEDDYDMENYVMKKDAKFANLFRNN